MDPLILSVPHGGNARLRAAYTEKCDQCMAVITQDMIHCEECGRPVEWQGSVIADKLARSSRNKRVDFQAKAKREQAERLSDTTGIVLAIARATAVTHKYEFPLGHEEELFRYEQAYGAKLVVDKLNEFKAAGEVGAGLVHHLIRYLASFNPAEKPKVNKDKSRLIKWD